MDFFTREGIDRYITNNGIDRCREITIGVAKRVRGILENYH